MAFISSKPTRDRLLIAITETSLIRSFISLINLSNVGSSIKSILLKTMIGSTLEVLQMVKYLSKRLILKSIY